MTFHVLAFHSLRFDDLRAVLLKGQNFCNVALCRWGSTFCLYVRVKLSKYRHMTLRNVGDYKTMSPSSRLKSCVSLLFSTCHWYIVV